MPPPSYFVRAKVRAIFPLARSVRRVTLAVPMTYCWRAGEYLEVTTTPEGDLRPYSIASGGSGSGGLDLLVGESEDAPSFTTGGQVFLTVPAGRPAVTVTAPRSVALVGMGTGVAPLRAVIEQQLAGASAPKLTLLLGSRTAAEQYFGAEFAALHDRGTLDYRPVLSQASPQWLGLRGRVQAHLTRLLPADAYCVCGSSEMTADVAAALLARGVEPHRVFAQGH